MVNGFDGCMAIRDEKLYIGEWVLSFNGCLASLNKKLYIGVNR